MSTEKTSAIFDKYYWPILVFITLSAVVLRFWHLGHIHELVFDEVYFPQFAHNYLTGKEFFDTHPPLSKYIIAAGIWIHNHLPWVDDPHYLKVEITELSAVSWRWVNALWGSALCLVVATLVRAIYPKALAALLAAAFIGLDGSFIVESRFGLNNIYLVGFGLCACLFFGKWFRAKDRHSSLLLLAACGIFLGFSYSVKWNGLGFSLAFWGLFIYFFMLNYAARELQIHTQLKQHTVWFNDPALLWQIPVFMILLPLVIYSLLWIPHISMREEYGFVEMQKQIFGYHSNSVKADEHPYCSRWYSWPMQLRPMSYYFVSDDKAADASLHRFYDIHLLGNPALYWGSVIAVLCLFPIWLRSSWRYVIGLKTPDLPFQTMLAFGFLANWLPWSLVSRCLFQYHYMASSAFAFLTTAYLLNVAWESEKRWLRMGVIGAMILFIAAFIFWLPIHLGTELKPSGFYQRMWLRSWI